MREYHSELSPITVCIAEIVMSIAPSKQSNSCNGNIYFVKIYLVRKMLDDIRILNLWRSNGYGI
jgi:hypothetical protein